MGHARCDQFSTFDMVELMCGNSNYVTQDILRRIMSDYFGYDIHFVMNITDIDDKASPHSLLLSPYLPLTGLQIITRARQNHVFETFRSEVKDASPDLIDRIRVAWRAFVQERVAKGLPDSERPSVGDEEIEWDHLTTRVQDTQWKLDCLRRDEKFDMYFSSAVRPLLSLAFCIV